jgi:hypothetical protein
MTKAQARQILAEQPTSSMVLGDNEWKRRAAAFLTLYDAKDVREEPDGWVSYGPREPKDDA